MSTRKVLPFTHCSQSSEKASRVHAASVQSTASGVFDEDEDKVPHRAGNSAGCSDVLAIAHKANAQRARLGKVTSLQATVDKSGPHPATATITGPATLTCLNAVSEVPNSKPAPSCHVVGPGFNTDLDTGHTAKLTGAGNVTLTCNGQGPMLRCSARVDIPPPSH